jgi:hypothetical protein
VSVLYDVASNDDDDDNVPSFSLLGIGVFVVVDGSSKGDVDVSIFTQEIINKKASFNETVSPSP